MAGMGQTNRHSSKAISRLAVIAVQLKFGLPEQHNTIQGTMARNIKVSSFLKYFSLNLHNRINLKW